MIKLDRKFYLRDTLIVAEDLLGKLLVHETGDHGMACKIVETEAYIGPEDKGSHSYGGRKTKRNEVMYHIGGTSYVYLIYGMYHCFNVVTEQADKPSAVLVRAVEPVEGVGQKLSLCNGPGKLCMAMGIGKAENGLDLCSSKLYLCDIKNEPFNIKTSPRINIDYAGEYALKPWRFYIEGNRYVSKR
ncbi:MAG: 3-methyladenine DNA glycosylase [Clostridia bacterium BRH_c25]|nr:MAG: 3-methyladenine DNA glycosylase [Clostridia bacterium BRH_c25]